MPEEEVGAGARWRRPAAAAAEEARASGEDDGEVSSRRTRRRGDDGSRVEDKVGEVGWWAIWAVLDLSFPFKAH